MCVTVVVTSLSDSCELSLRVHLRTEPRVCGFSCFGGLLTHPFNLNTNSYVMSLWLCSCFPVVTVEFSVA